LAVLRLMTSSNLVGFLRRGGEETGAGTASAYRCAGRRTPPGPISPG
jgi:hypothetical protein